MRPLCITVRCPAYILELRGEPLVLLGQLRDQEALLPLGGPGVDLRLLEEAAEARDVALQLRHLQLVLLLHPLQPPPQVVLLLLQLLQHVVITPAVCRVGTLAPLVTRPRICVETPANTLNTTLEMFQ